MGCTPQGLRISEAMGRHLPELHGNFAHAKVIANAQQRNMDTAAALLRGLGQDDSDYTTDVGVFDTMRGDEPLCKLETSQSEIQAQVRTRLSTVPMPWDLESAKLEMQQLLGVGAAGPLVDMPGPQVVLGGLSGSTSVIKYFAQDLLYTYASDIHYLNATVDQRYRLIAWLHWHRRVAYWHEQTATRNAKLLRTVLEHLSADSMEPSTHIYVGHDDNLDALSMFLNLSWEAPPFMIGSLPTPPGSGLLFEYDEYSDIVNVSFLYNTFEVSSGPRLGFPHRSPVLSVPSLAQFRARAMAGLHCYPDAVKCFQATADAGARSHARVSIWQHLALDNLRLGQWQLSCLLAVILAMMIGACSFSALVYSLKLKRWNIGQILKERFTKSPDLAACILD